jgi:hypothetical protein
MQIHDGTRRKGRVKPEVRHRIAEDVGAAFPFAEVRGFIDRAGQ